MSAEKILITLIMKFKYQARNKSGELQVGNVEAPTKDAAVSVLTSHDLFVLSISSQERRGLEVGVYNFINRVKVKDLMVFMRQLATLIESELPLGNSLKILYEQTKNPILKEAVFQIYQDVESGLSFSQAIERQKPIFSDFFVSMIRSAEVSGRLEQALTFLAAYEEKEAEWKSRIGNAMIYPLVLMGLFVIIGGLMVVLVFPQLETVFTQSNVQMPALTQVVFGIGNFIVSWWWVVLLAIGMVSYTFVDYFKSKEGKAVAGQLLLMMPVFGNLFRKIYITRFAQSFSVLIQGGIPVTQAIEVAGDTIDNVVYREVFIAIAQGVREGALLSQLLGSYEKFFPPMVGQMAAIGETTGRLDDIMLKVANFYEREVNAVMGNLSELIQPILILVMGVLVAILFASILTPIYNLAASFAN